MTLSPKSALRQEIRRRLATLPVEVRRDASEKISAVLVGRPEWNTTTVLGLYLSLPDEPETRNVIRLAWDAGKTVALPKIDIRHGLTWWKILPGPLPVLPTLWEPLPGRHDQVAIESIGGFAIPGRAFDSHGTRLGRGGGHYDRSLALRNRQAWVTGLFFAIQEMAGLPREAHDVTLPQVITETGWKSL